MNQSSSWFCFIPIKFPAQHSTQGIHSQFLRNRRANLIFLIKNKVLLVFGFELLAALNASERQALPVLRRPLPPKTRVDSFKEGTGCRARLSDEASDWGEVYG